MLMAGSLSALLATVPVTTILPARAQWSSIATCWSPSL